MVKSRLLGALCAAVFSVITLPSHATLTYVLGGQAIYDSDPNSASAWLFEFSSGSQDFGTKSATVYAWAVQSGNAGAAMVPVPAAVWLFGSGLLGLIGISRRKKSNY